MELLHSVIRPEKQSPQSKWYQLNENKAHGNAGILKKTTCEGALQRLPSFFHLPGCPTKEMIDARSTEHRRLLFFHGQAVQIEIVVYMLCMCNR